MLTTYSRVTVVSGERTVDLALPSALPLADVVPQILRFCAPQPAGEPASWTLARLGGHPLAMTQTLSDAGVLDGDILELRARHADVRPALVEDVRDLVEDSTDAAGGVWRPATTVTFCLVAGAVVLGGLGAATYLGLGALAVDDLMRIVSCVAAVAALLGATAWAGRVSYAWVGQVCLTAALGWAYLLGASIAESAALEPAYELIVGATLVAVAAGIGRLLTPAAVGHLAWSVVVLAAGLAVAVCDLLDVEAAHAVRVTPVFLLLAVGALPRLSLSVGGLASADYRVRNVSTMTTQQLAARFRESNGLLVGGLVGISTVLVWAGLWLAFSDSLWDRYLGVTIGVVALLRSRVFSRVQHMVALRAAAVLVLAAQAARLAADSAVLRDWLLILVAVLFVVIVALSSMPMSEVSRARVKRVLNIVEFLLVVEMLVITCGAVGVFGALGNLV